MQGQIRIEMDLQVPWNLLSIDAINPLACDSPKSR
jgi:hypothetical protein